MAEETIDLSPYDEHLTQLWGDGYHTREVFREWWDRMEREKRPPGYRTADLIGLIAEKRDTEPKSVYRPW